MTTFKKPNCGKVTDIEHLWYTFDLSRRDQNAAGKHDEPTILLSVAISFTRLIFLEHCHCPSDFVIESKNESNSNAFSITKVPARPE